MLVKFQKLYREERERTWESEWKKGIGKQGIVFDDRFQFYQSTGKFVILVGWPTLIK